MLNESHFIHLRLGLVVIASACCVSGPSPAFAADPVSPLLAAASGEPAALPSPVEGSEPAAAATPSQNVTVNLINRLVKRGVLTKDDASELIKQAEDDALVARAQAAAAQSAAAPPPLTNESIRVTYIPETVKAQMRDEIKQEVMAQARDENWADPRTLPAWVTRFKLFGDVRFRYQGDMFPSGNATGLGSGFWNYNAINSGSPYDYLGQANPAYYNDQKDRNRFRLRVRFGAEATLGDGFTAGFRIGTGENSSPVTQNQTLGGTGGDFSKYSVWLDRGFIKYELGGDSSQSLSLTVGRFDNPFFGTTMIWADELGFDGGVVKGKYEVLDGFTPFLTMGAFPVYNTDFNYSTYSSTKFASYDKWLEAIQGGADWKINKDFSLKLAVAYYYYQNIEGKVSDPFVPLTVQDAGDTDASRPSFAQSGNTYIALRDITGDSTNNYGASNQWQYFGLATPFHELALTGRLDFSHFDPFHVSLTGEIVKNLAFDRTAIENNGPSNLLGPVNNLAANTGVFNGGDVGWMVTLTFGNAVLEKRWDWTFNLGYRYVESDAVVDGFTDGDFGGYNTGTNLKGFTVGGSLALSARTWLRFCWMSADNISGSPLKTDTIQFDFNAKF